MCAVLLASAAARVATPAADPFAFFQPSLVVDADDRRRLDRGEPIARTIPAANPELAVFAAVAVRADGDRLHAWMRRIEVLKKSPYVVAIGRFSAPPRPDDVAALELEDADVSAVRKCRPGRCDVKLTADEMARLRRAIDAAGAGWRAAVQDTFRQIAVERVQAYLAGGHAAVGAYADVDPPGPLDASFSRLVRHSAFLTARRPELADYLVRYPRAPCPDVESFVYWSKERLGARPIVSATHVTLLRGTGESEPEALVLAKTVWATHYIDASLAITALVRGEPRSRAYLVYFNRTDVDVLDRAFSGLTRWIMQRRLKADASDVLRGIARRLESGDPGTAPSGGTP